MAVRAALIVGAFILVLGGGALLWAIVGKIIQKMFRKKESK